MVDATEPGVLIYNFDTVTSEMVAMLAGLSILNPAVSTEASNVIEVEFGNGTLPDEFQVPDTVAAVVGF